MNDGKPGIGDVSGAAKESIVYIEISLERRARGVKTVENPFGKAIVWIIYLYVLCLVAYIPDQEYSRMGEIQRCEALVCAVEVKAGAAAVFGLLGV